MTGESGREGRNRRTETDGQNQKDRIGQDLRRFGTEEKCRIFIG